MSCLGNILWFIFGGFLNSIFWFVLGILWSITIIGIPIGKQCFKMARLQFAPFGTEIVTTGDGLGSFVLNVLWVIFGGLEMCIANLISAFFMAITIVGFPFAIQALKLAKLSLMPFGKELR